MVCGVWSWGGVRVVCGDRMECGVQGGVRVVCGVDVVCAVVVDTKKPWI